MSVKYIIPIGENNGTNKTFVKFIDKIIRQKGLDVFISDEIVTPDKDLLQKVESKIEEVSKVIAKNETYFLVFNETVFKNLSKTDDSVKSIDQILDFINSAPQDISAIFQTVAPYIDGYLQTRLSSNTEQQK